MNEAKDYLTMCEDNSCKILWFHFKSMLIKKNPKGNRFCPEFRKKRKVMQKRKCSRQFYGLLTVAENLFKFFSPVCRISH